MVDDVDDARGASNNGDDDWRVPSETHASREGDDPARGDERHVMVVGNLSYD